MLKDVAAASIANSPTGISAADAGTVKRVIDCALIMRGQLNDLLKQKRMNAFCLVEDVLGPILRMLYVHLDVSSPLFHAGALGENLESLVAEASSLLVSMDKRKTRVNWGEQKTKEYWAARQQPARLLCRLGLLRPVLEAGGSLVQELPSVLARCMRMSEVAYAKAKEEVVLPGTWADLSFRGVQELPVRDLPTGKSLVFYIAEGGKRQADGKARDGGGKRSKGG